MNAYQESKYKIDGVNERLVNRHTGLPIPDDEPLFVLRARDIHAVATLDFYAGFPGHSPEHRAAVEERINAFEEFEAKYPDRMKQPD